VSSDRLLILVIYLLKIWQFSCLAVVITMVTVDQTEWYDMYVCNCCWVGILWVCVCSLRYPACNAHVPYCNLCPAQLYNIFPHYLTNGTILEKKLLNTECVFWFFLQISSKTFRIVRRTERDMIKNVYRSACKVPVIVRF
jgi:hypothetical protein